MTEGVSIYARCNIKRPPRRRYCDMGDDDPQVEEEAAVGTDEVAAEGDGPSEATEGDAAALPGEDSEEAAAATKIAAVRRGKLARRALNSKGGEQAAGGEEGDEGGADTFGDEDGLEEQPEEEESEESEGDDLGDEDEEDEFEGGEGYGDFDMLEAAQVDADEEQVEEDKANLAELFKQAQEEKSAFQDLNQVRACPWAGCVK